MRDFRDAKAMAQSLRKSLTTKAIDISHSESLELVSKMLGVADWNTLSALLQADRRTPENSGGTTSDGNGKLSGHSDQGPGSLSDRDLSALCRTGEDHEGPQPGVRTAARGRAGGPN